VYHDRYFLDHVATKIIELENKECETYIGDYSEYIRQKDENLRIQFDNFKEQKKKINNR
jgi:ATPase subunit of ABC transporter with duplicated ATPase domains